MENSKYVIGVRNFDGKEYVKYDSYQQLANEMIRENEKLRKEINCLSKERENFKSRCFRYKDNLEEFQKDFAGIDEKNKALEAENASLREKITKAQIQRLTGECDGSCACEQDQEDEVDLEALVYELQEQHQQDCIRINDLTTTVSVLSSLYTNLRKNVGMD